MKVEVVYALPDRVDVVSVSVPPGATLRDAVVASGLAQRHPEISLEKQAFGIFGRRVLPETRLAPGDRVFLELKVRVAADAPEDETFRGNDDVFVGRENAQCDLAHEYFLSRDRDAQAFSGWRF